jgi:alpha-tubulin suppressor-like RCC1 family protein
VYCWGGNNARQLGSPAGAQSAEAVVVPDVDGATAIDSGDAFSCATVDSILHCWGSANYYEASSVGGAANDTAAPAQRFDGAVAATGLGTQFGCAISDTGEIGCWGINGRGEYGNNTILVSAGDELVTPLGAGFANAGPWRDLDAAFGTACAVSDEGQVWCWGSYNDFGERGRGDTLRTNQNPTEVNTLPSAFVATEVAVGSSFACALGAVEGGAETVYCWGDDTYGQQAHGESALDADGASVPLPLHRVSWDLPVAGVDFTCARAADARGDKDIFCWGANESGQSNPSSPGAAIFGPSLVEHGLASFPKALVAGTSHVCAANGEGGDASICWGDNGRQQLGNSDTGNHFFALDYAAGSPAALAAGPISSCRLIGASWECWGGDQDPAIDVALAPFGVVKLGPGFRCGLGTFDVDKVRCQGENGSGQLGNGTNDSAVFIDTANGITGHGLSVGATAQTCARSSTVPRRAGARMPTERRCPARPVTCGSQPTSARFRTSRRS